eukprot:gb/GEZN01004011.1/.p1 GENE.gb/GEZN01004011.1/~~gb/GEZN01004011.1/.p1  ORF type:complete len:627 (-),score=59.40 gb/GEZN01004011.1/:167-2020(-)
MPRPALCICFVLFLFLSQISSSEGDKPSKVAQGAKSNPPAKAPGKKSASSRENDNDVIFENDGKDGRDGDDVQDCTQMILTHTLATALHVSVQEICHLYSAVKGEIVAENSPAYASLVQPTYMLANWLRDYPVLVVRPRTAADVKVTVQWANRNGVSVSPAAGRHGSEGSCFYGSISIDVQTLNSTHLVQKGSHSPLLVVGSGALFGPILDFLTGFGLAATTGVCEGVGICGWTLGGGYSPLSKVMGIGVDAVEALEVVLADGSLVTANSSGPYSDLFWAMRGAGHQSFGIVTQLTVRTLPLRTIPYASITVPLQDDPDFAATVLREWARLYFGVGEQAQAGWSDSNFTTYSVRWGREYDPQSAAVMNFELLLPDDSPTAMQRFLRLLQPFLDFIGDQAIFIQIQALPFSQIRTFDDTFVQGVDLTSPAAEWKVGIYLSHQSLFDLAGCSQLVAAILSYLDLERRSPAAYKGFYVVLEPYAGAAISPTPSETAFYHRENVLGDFYFDVFTSVDNKQAGEEALEFLASLYQPWNSASGVQEPAKLSGLLKLYNGTFQAYKNYAQMRYGSGNVEERWPALVNYYGGNLCRLVQVKQRYDHELVFDFPQGIPVKAPTGQC